MALWIVWTFKWWAQYRYLSLWRCGFWKDIFNSYERVDCYETVKLSSFNSQFLPQVHFYRCSIVMVFTIVPLWGYIRGSLVLWFQPPKLENKENLFLRKVPNLRYYYNNWKHIKIMSKLWPWCHVILSTVRDSSHLWSPWKMFSGFHQPQTESYCFYIDSNSGSFLPPMIMLNLIITLSVQIFLFHILVFINIDSATAERVLEQKT